MLVRIHSWLSSVGDYVLERVLPAALMLLIGILVIRLVLQIVQKCLDASRLEKAAHSLIKSLIRVLLYLLLGLSVASGLGIDVTGIVALASVLTLAISLSVQNMLTNVIGGFTLLYTKPFHSGDYVDVGSDSGTVTEIGMTYTKLLTADNKLISIPNATVVAANIVNYSVTGTRRVAVKIRVAYCEPSQKILDALVQAGTVDKVLMDPPPTAVIAGYTQTAVEYSLRVWTKTEDYWDVTYIIHENIKNIFDAQKIKTAYPQMHVHMEKE